MALKRAPISVIIITKNENQNIRPCLESVQWADEIIVVDSGSTDNTYSIAKTLGARVIHNDWPGYGPQKRFATEQAKHDWILSIDADERISPQLASNITKEMQSPHCQAYALKRLNHLLGKPLRHGSCMNNWIIRLFNRKFAGFNLAAVHESVEVKGNSSRILGDLYHFSAPSLTFYIEKINHYTDIQADKLLENQSRVGWVHVTLVPFWSFFRSFILKLGFLDGIAGLIYAYTAALTSFLKYAKTLDKTFSSKKPKVS